ncbi:MAG TPA: chromosome segregation protein SMC [Planctomycetes bacterium]|nr:chromosome segregation protein SMC [Planctomycetota bacterium]
MGDPVFLKRVVLTNFKSIKGCIVNLGPLTFLVGQNGAGKSNFLDALRLVTEALSTTLEHALRDRGGINEVRRRSTGHPTHFGMRLDWALPDGTQGTYAFRVGARPKGGFAVQQEECTVVGPPLSEEHYFSVHSGRLKATSFGRSGPPAVNDRLYLVSAASMHEFRPLFDALSHMGFYNLNPDVIRELQPPDPGEILQRDGRNLASVLARMAREKSPARTQIIEFLSRIVPGLDDVGVRLVLRKETLEFKQVVNAAKARWRFPAESMSDGTLRALGVLTALLQSGNNGDRSVPLVGIEEPELALHPGAAGILRDALRTASRTAQVIVTSHSPDLLDDKEILDQHLLAVVNRNGETLIGPPDASDRASMRDRLYTAGELLRMSRIEPDEKAARPEAVQLELFPDMPSCRK